MTWTEVVSLGSSIGLALFVGVLFHGVKSLIEYIRGDRTKDLP